MTITHGTWGDRHIIFENDFCIVTYLKLKPKKRCSYHYHQTAYNKFYVLDGILGVKTEKGYSEVAAGESFTTEPGLKHEFITPFVAVKVIEIAYVKYNPGDIIRESLGGDL